MQVHQINKKKDYNVGIDIKPGPCKSYAQCLSNPLKFFNKPIQGNILSIVFILVVSGRFKKL